MPCYLVHGFRWPRKGIRVYIVLENIDDAAAEYLAAPKTTSALIKDFQQKFPEDMKHLPKLRFVEQYDPSDTSSKALSQPYAFVVDKAKSFDLSLNVKQSIDELESGIGEEQIAAMLNIKKKLAPDEELGWWVVYNGDEGRTTLDQEGLSGEIRKKGGLRRFLNIT